MSSELVTLRNGTQEGKAGVAVMHAILSNLMDTQPIVFFELVSFARDRNHKFWGDCGDELVKRNILSKDGTGTYSIHETTKNIIVSSVEGDGMDMTLVDPRKES